MTNCELQFINADIRDADTLNKIFIEFKPETVIHFTGLKAVGEIVIMPLKYFNANIIGFISLLESMDRYGCMNIVFSSIATVYGNADYLPYDEKYLNDEKYLTNPINPYGRTKLMVEKIVSYWTEVDNSRRGIVLSILIL